MYQYSFDENTTKEIEESTKNSKNLLEKFSDIDKKYDTLTNSNSELNLTKMEYSVPSVFEVETKAKNKLEDYRNSNVNAIEEKYATKIDQVDEQKNDIKSNTAKEIATLEQRYNQIKDDAKNDAIKRGLARSSIVVNTLNNVDLKKLESIKELESTANDKIEKLNSTKNSLETEKQNALSSFNISYAVKLQDEINSITEEIEKNKQSIIKYNNEVENLMAKWQKEQEDDEYEKTTKLAKLISEYGISVFDTLKQNEKYALASEHFLNINKSDALKELNNNNVYKSELGKINYNKLLEEINSRK